MATIYFTNLIRDIFVMPYDTLNGRTPLEAVT